MWRWIMMQSFWSKTIAFLLCFLFHPSAQCITFYLGLVFLIVGNKSVLKRLNLKKMPVCCGSSLCLVSHLPHSSNQTMTSRFRPTGGISSPPTRRLKNPKTKQVSSDSKKNDDKRGKVKLPGIGKGLNPPHVTKHQGTWVETVMVLATCTLPFNIGPYYLSWNLDGSWWWWMMNEYFFFQNRV